MRHGLIGILVLVFGLSAFPAPASAGPMLWTLSSVTFDDGATATGSFDFDPATGYSNILITISGGSLAADLEGSYQYYINRFGGPQGGDFLMSPYAQEMTGVPLLGLYTSVPLTTSIGTIPIAWGFVGTCFYSDCSGPTIDSFILTPQTRNQSLVRPLNQLPQS